MRAPRPLLDRAVIDDLVEHIGAAAWRSVADMFCDESRELVATIAAAPDREIARKAAHSLKSGAGQIGAAALSAAAAAVEGAAAATHPRTPLIEALADCAAATEAALVAMMAEMRS